jgi:TolB-like protein
MSFVAQLKQRKLVQWLLAYAAGAWLFLQVASLVSSSFGWSPTVMRGVTIAAGIGFLIALLLAWYHGERGAQRISGTELLLLTLLLLIGGGLLWKFAPEPAAAPGTAAPSSAIAGPSADAVPAKSIAVLAFANMSADQDNEYFSDGVSEEILNALAKLDGLKVAGRTASFYFKGRNEPLAAIGSTLGVAHVLEGSVRKQGERLRITAQLIRVSDGMHLWSESFDGTDADVFALQETVARNVADRLKVALNLDAGTSLVNTGTANAEAYALYLQASSIFNRRDRARFHDAIDVLKRAVQIDPNYARAYARLASMHVVLSSYTNADPRETHPEVMRYAEKALALDPALAEAWGARGGSLGKFPETQVQAREAFEQAMRLNPNDTTASFWNGLNLLTTGYRSQGTAQIEHVLTIDPMLPNALRWRGMLYLQEGDVARAEPLLQRAYDLGLLNTANALSEIAMARGDAEASARLWADGSMGLDFNLTRDELLTVHRGIFGDAAAKQVAIKMLLSTLSRLGGKKALPTTPLYLFRLDAPSEGLAILRERTMGEGIDSMNWIWTRQGAKIRALPEFGDFLRRYHFPELWDKFGPPDVCRKGADGEYVCSY